MKTSTVVNPLQDWRPLLAFVDESISELGC